MENSESEIKATADQARLYADTVVKAITSIGSEIVIMADTLDKAFNKTSQSIQKHGIALQELISTTKNNENIAPKTEDKHQQTQQTSSTLPTNQDTEKKNTEKSLTEQINLYGSYYEKRQALKDKWDKTLSEVPENLRAGVSKSRDKEIAALDDEYAKSTDFIIRLFGNMANKTAIDIKAMEAQARQLLDFLQSGKWDKATGELFNISEEQFNKLSQSKEELKKLTDKTIELNSSTNTLKTSYGKLGDAIQLWTMAKKNIEKAEEATNEAIKESDLAKAKEQRSQAWDKFISGANEALSVASNIVSKLQELAKATNNDSLSSSMAKASAMLSFLKAAGDGAKSGGWIGAIIGAVKNLVEQGINAYANYQQQTYIAEQSALNFARALDLVKLKMSDEDKIFGINGIGRAAEAWHKAQEAVLQMNDAIDSYSEGDIDKKVGFEWYKMFVSWEIAAGTADQISSKWKALQEAHANGYKGLETMLIKTRDRTGFEEFFGAQDEYTSLKDLAPDLWDKETGKFDVDAAKAFLETNKQLNSEQKELIQNIIDLDTKYEELMNVVEAELKDTFGYLTDDLTEMLVDSIVSGTDAWKDFRKAGVQALETLGKKLVQELFFAEKFKALQEQLKEAYGKGSPEEIAAEQARILAGFFDGFGPTMENANNFMEQWQKKAAEMGFDIWGADDMEATKKGFASMTQDTADELNGRFTAIQSHTYLISQQTSLLAINSANILNLLGTISTHTVKLVSMETSMKNLQTGMTDIVTKGVLLRR
ncbi:MAG: hypothetical protein LBQ31_09245 [Bacteroidales bacterium]|jgi:hypothetical protein|nr:hypothetical protein [Bacteroidales bacterium]